MGTTTVEIGHDYIPNWNQSPATVIKVDSKRGGVQVEFYTGHQRWFTLRAFKISFSHYKDCVQCTKGG